MIGRNKKCDLAVALIDFFWELQDDLRHGLTKWLIRRIFFWCHYDDVTLSLDFLLRIERMEQICHNFRTCYMKVIEIKRFNHSYYPFIKFMTIKYNRIQVKILQLKQTLTYSIEYFFRKRNLKSHFFLILMVHWIFLTILTLKKCDLWDL